MLMASSLYELDSRLDIVPRLFIGSDKLKQTKIPAVWRIPKRLFLGNGTRATVSSEAAIHNVINPRFDILSPHQDATRHADQEKSFSAESIEIWEGASSN